VVVGRRVHYAWVIAAVTFLILVTAAGFRATPGVLMTSLESSFGWSPALIGGAVSVNLVCYGLGAPFAAAIVERFGLRRVAACALAVIAVGAAATTRMTSPWQMYLLWGVVVGTCTGAIAVPLAAIVANRWFDRRRGLVTGFMTASNASGQLVFAPVMAAVAVSSGWRSAALIVAVTAAFVVLPLTLLFLRDRPRDVGLLPYGATEEPPPPAPMGNPFRSALSTLGEASHNRDFWLLAAAFFVCGATTNGLIGTHLIAACADHGLSEVTGASMLAVIGIFDVIGTVSSGWLTDRYDPRWLLFWYYGLRGLALIGLNAALSSAGLGLGAFILFYGLDWVATVPPTVALCRRAFGPEKVGVVFAWVFAAHQFGAAFAAWGAGASRTWFGTYWPAFVVAGCLGCIAALLSLLVGRRLIIRPQPAPA
jgi:sugar phosphate permease